LSTWRTLVRDVAEADEEVREGHLQRSLSLIAGLSSILSGAEVLYEHYRGSYGHRIMYSPVLLSPLLLGAGVAGVFSRRAARRLLPAVSILVLADGVTGFGFHVRGICRKPGGWRLPVANIIMGPPIFAPLLFGVSGYVGLLAPILRIREGRYQKHLAAATAASSLFSGFEALYSHYKNNFRYPMQWTPIALSGLLTGVALAAVGSPRVARTWLPAVSLLAMADGGIGFYYHARGVMRRPGGLSRPFYNVMYGPPIFAPLLFAACGFLGGLASLLRREA
jgi:hypothetical protein